jgi:hypothetical protein
MADVPLTTGLIVLAQERRGDIVSQINRRSTLLRTVPIRPGGSQNVAWVAEGDGQVAENYAEGADAVNFGSNAQNSAILNWGHYRATMKITGTALRTARTSSSPAALRDLWAYQQDNAIRKLASTINAELFAGPGTGTRLAGLDAAIGSDTNTYATIDRSQSANAFWRPYVIDPGSTTPLTFAQIRTDRTALYNASGEKPDIAFTSSAIFNTIGGLFDNNRRYITDINTARGQVRLDAGYGALEVDGMLFMEDRDATSNRIYYINTSAVHIEYLPSDQATLDPGSARLAANDGYGVMPLGIQYDALAKTGDNKKAEVLVNLQLVVDRPNACGVRLNVQAAA